MIPGNRVSPLGYARQKLADLQADSPGALELLAVLPFDDPAWVDKIMERLHRHFGAYQDGEWLHLSEIKQAVLVGCLVVMIAQFPVTAPVNRLSSDRPRRLVAVHLPSFRRAAGAVAQLDDTLQAVYHALRRGPIVKDAGK